MIDKRFLEHLDLSYAVNTEKYEKHRALHLGTQGAAHANIYINVIFIRLGVIYIFPRSVHLFCCSQIDRPIVGIYKSLTDI